VQVRLVESITDVDPKAWDALCGEDDPFIEHAFLKALEDSGSAGGRSGWDPMHVTVWDGPTLVGAMPLYKKDHSYGEYIFDWAWADAAHRLGIDYYPKLVSMVPVTPVTGTRLLIAEGRARKEIAASIVEGTFAAAEETEASSVHVNFVSAGERDEMMLSRRFMPRTTFQFHWHNQGYESFEHYLDTFRASARKQVRRERRTVAESGLTILTKTGPELDADEWSTLFKFYRDTCARKGSPSYLTPRFFKELRGPAGARALAVLAYDRKKLIAATLNFEKGRHVYGRYWGAVEDRPHLHFELCYYRLIERAIDRKMARFEAGAQGMHKLKRGLLPHATHSLHWIRHPVLAAAVGDYLPREARGVRAEIAALTPHGPFRRGQRDGDG
jgi:predicted N-acyltransferase